jgi:hypothetical protein
MEDSGFKHPSESSDSDHLWENMQELNIADDDPTKAYRRPRLIPLKNELGVFPFEKIKAYACEKYKFEEIAGYIDFYHYNCESIEDYGWGCAWRCIQILLSAVKKYSEAKIFDNLNMSFENLFNTYGKRDTLDNIYQKLHGVDYTPEYLKAKKYAPFETDSGWGEPFLAQLILFDITGIKGNLYLLNSHPNFAYAPVEVFNPIPLTFLDFKNKLIANFQKEKPLPVMIDDSLVTLMIIGIKVIDEIVTLLILDPHLVEPEKGIYTVTLDKDGDFDPIANVETTKNGKRFKMKERPWMILLID